MYIVNVRGHFYFWTVFRRKKKKKTLKVSLRTPRILNYDFSIVKLFQKFPKNITLKCSVEPFTEARPQSSFSGIKVLEDCRLLFEFSQRLKFCSFILITNEECSLYCKVWRIDEIFFKKLKNFQKKILKKFKKFFKKFQKNFKNFKFFF